MLDQNITTLLAASIGGILSISGGFLANYYAQSTTRRNNQEENIKKMIEDVYTETQSIESFYDEMLSHIKEYEEDPYLMERDPDTEYRVARGKAQAFEGNTEKSLNNVKGSLRKIDLLVTLYFHPLQEDFKQYQSKLDPYIKGSWSDSDSTNEIVREEFLQIGKQFQIALSKFLKRKGYSYK